MLDSFLFLTNLIKAQNDDAKDACEFFTHGGIGECLHNISKMGGKVVSVTWNFPSSATWHRTHDIGDVKQISR